MESISVIIADTVAKFVRSCCGVRLVVRMPVLAEKISKKEILQHQNKDKMIKQGHTISFQQSNIVNKSGKYVKKM